MKLRSLFRQRRLRDFGLVWRWQNWLRLRFTRNGQYLLLALLITAILGLNTRQTLVHQIFGLIFALLLLAFVLTSRWLVWLHRLPKQFKISRQFPAHGSVGNTAFYHFQISHAQPQPLRGYSLIECPHDPRPTRAQFEHALEPGALQRNWFDRAVGYYRWAWLLKMNQVSHIAELPLPMLAAQQNYQLSHRFTPFARGHLVLSGVWLARTDPLGLCRALRYIELPGAILVLPSTWPTPPAPLPVSRHAQHEFAASVSGDGEEFVGLRSYRPGDSLRMIHWKSFARLGSPVVKEYQTEFFTRYAILLDTVQAPAGQAFEDAIALSASLVSNLHQPAYLLDLLYTDNACQIATCGHGQLQVEALLHILAGLQASQVDLLAQLQASVLARHDELSACICVLLDWDQPRAKFVQQLLELGLPLQVWLVHDHPLQRFPLPHPEWLRIFQAGHCEEQLRALHSSLPQEFAPASTKAESENSAESTESMELPR